jgi:hypothetical protein
VRQNSFRLFFTLYLLSLLNLAGIMRQPGLPYPPFAIKGKAAYVFTCLNAAACALIIAAQRYFRPVFGPKILDNMTKGCLLRQPLLFHLR